MSKRVLIISDSVFRQTGYSTVTKSILSNMNIDDYEIAQLGISYMPTDYSTTEYDIDYYSPVLNHSKCCNTLNAIEYYNHKQKELKYIQADLTVDEMNIELCNQGIPNPQDPYGFDSAFYVIRHFKPDIVIVINDVWGMYKLQFLKNRKDFKLISYLAVDSECFPIQINSKETINTFQFLTNCDQVVVFTDWAKKTINKSANFIIKRDLDNIKVIPHGVDLDKFNVLSKDERYDFASRFFNVNLDEVFLIGSINRNQPRKRLDAIFQILKILKEKYENPKGKKFMVHFHCAVKDSNGWDLNWLSMFYGVADRVILDNNLRPGVGVPDEILNKIMNTYDVHLVPTNSEGWGLSILETMACGVPNVISDYSAHGDWAKKAALKINLAAKIHEPITNHIKGIIDVNHAAKQINQLYYNTKLYNETKKQSLKLADRLQWSKICVKWNELIDEMDISDLSIDRYNAELFDSNNLLPFPDNPIETEFKVLEI